MTIPEPPPKTPYMTRRQREVATLISEGFQYKEIASRLGCSVRTVKFHMEKLFDEYGVRSRTELVCLLCKEKT